MRAMLGTGAWFYLVVNVAKVPLSAGLGLITSRSMVLDALLVPAMLVGAGAGMLLVARLGQRHFEVIALAFSALAAGLLML